MQVLGCLLTLLLAGFIIVLSVGFSIIDAVLRMFGLGRRRPTINRDEQPTTASVEPQKKKIADDEGEYIDFEEV